MHQPWSSGHWTSSWARLTTIEQMKAFFAWIARSCKRSRRFRRCWTRTSLAIRPRRSSPWPWEWAICTATPTVNSKIRSVGPKTWRPRRSGGSRALSRNPSRTIKRLKKVIRMTQKQAWSAANTWVKSAWKNSLMPISLIEESQEVSLRLSSRKWRPTKSSPHRPRRESAASPTCQQSRNQGILAPQRRQSAPPRRTSRRPRR